MAIYTAAKAARDLGVSQEFLRMKLRQGYYSDIGEAIPPGRGHRHWRFPCYPAKVAQRTGRPILHDGIRYYPDGRVEGGADMIQSWPYCWARLPGRRCQRLGTEITPEECQVCFFRSQKPPEEPEPEAVQEKSPPSDRTHGGRMGHMVTPLSGIVGRKYKESRPSKEEFQKIKEKRESRPCKTCRYHASLNGNQGYIYCNYLEITGYVRPCKPEERKPAGIWGKKDKGEPKAPRRPFQIVPTREPDEEDELIAKIKREQEKERQDEKL